MSFPVAEAQVVALFMESIAYGVYVVTLGIACRVLFFDNQGMKKRVNWSMVVVVALMAIFSTLDVSLGLRHNLDAFIFYKGPGGPDAEFDNISYWVNVMKTVDTQMMSLIGDGMLIYRCFVIFSHKWLIIAFPLLMWLANVACSVMIIFITATLRQDTTISQQRLLKPFLYSFFIITIALNLLTTSMIVWKIWRVNKDSSPNVPHISTAQRGLPRSRLEKVIRIIIESGMLYTLFVIMTFICELAGSNAIYGVSDVLVVVVGISFNLIIIRVDSSNNVPNSSYIESGVPSYPLRLVRASKAPTSPGGRGVEVMISRDIDRDIAESDKHGSIKAESRDAWGAV
ncbi:hypothetical protein PHLCEN_2v8765 [Hermanssonia centrifuga]|uniref:Uncharacterized protein n=1 Tax=Hermanssonia centrifuga TaxID=98765 RepID=A0A2R6NTH7_9APHY|nr:hypothetical protein PHLCEN_2v8765 [Hermanssonia centrifuga]